MDFELRVPQMMFDDVDQCGKKGLQRGAVSVAFEIAVERVEKPEGRVRRMIQALLRAFGEHVWYQTVTNVMGEGAQNITCLQRDAPVQGSSLPG